jgi:hypothetical protein
MDEEVLKGALKESASLKEFRDLLKRWYHLNLRIIENYRRRKRG